MERYEVWESDDGGCLFPATERDRQLGLMGGKPRLISSFEAETWDDAMKQYHILMGYEEYVPH